MHKKENWMIACMIVTMLVGCSITLAAETETVTLTAEADAYVKQGEPDTNFGSEQDLKANLHGDLNYCLKSYIRFDISQIEYPIVNATLNLTITAFTGDDYRHTQIGRVADGDPGENWDENTITWNNAPAHNPDIAYIYQQPGDAVGNVDSVTPSMPSMILYFLQDDTDGKVTFVVDQSIWWAQSRTYASRENETYAAPTLEITYELPSLLEGDANRDGVVSAGDYASVQANFGSTGDPGILGDANGDGVVSAGDYASVQANFGNTNATEVVPEPATMSLLTVVGIFGLRHRRNK